MFATKTFALSTAIAAFITTFALAEDTKPKSTNAPEARFGTNTVKRISASQADVASKTAKFGKVSKTDEVYKSALEAHALPAALKQAGKDGAFKGKVSGIYEPRGMAILNFDANYRTALTALLKKDGFEKFPALTNLVEKEVVVTGKFVDYQGRAEIILTNAGQIKLVQ